MKSVAINGYGTIGKRVADAVAAQDDMKVIGVSKTRPNYESRTAVEEKGYDLYIGIPERADQFKEAGIEIAGTVDQNRHTFSFQPIPFSSANFRRAALSILRNSS